MSLTTQQIAKRLQAMSVPAIIAQPGVDAKRELLRELVIESLSDQHREVYDHVVRMGYSSAPAVMFEFDISLVAASTILGELFKWGVLSRVQVPNAGTRKFRYRPIRRA